jgi:hypothetical protein
MELYNEAAASPVVSKTWVGGGSFESSISVMIFSDPLVAVDANVVVESSSSTSQPRTTLSVDRTRLAVVVVTVPETETPYDVVVTAMVADSVSHEVGSEE